jgi:hypothetical protein
MAGTAKSCYLSVYDRAQRKTVFNKVFFKMADLNQYIRDPEFIEKYPADKFDIVKEVY